jgi:hypothetical protein
MPAYSSHYLQSLDIGCHASVKTIYGRFIGAKLLAGVNLIDNRDLYL